MENTTQPTQITVNDLDSIRTIIDVAFKRGAFSASEAAEVGSIYNKLSSFLEAVVAQATPGQEAGAATTESQGSQGE